MITIASVTPTILSLMGIPDKCMTQENPLDAVVRAAKSSGIETVDKVLIYAPDAVGVHLHSRFQSSFDAIRKIAPISITLHSVVPTYTPVCFATMFTGLQPYVHGIQKYEKPVLETPTLFDSVLSAGKRVAIVAVADSSIDIIFRKRRIDYFSEKYDPQVTERSIELLEADKHDLIVGYHQEYDDMLHRNDPFSPEAIQAMNNHIRSFDSLARAFNKYWQHYNRLIVFAPDHGAHVDPDTGKGSHGLDIPEDMDLIHYYGVYDVSS